jgi:uncharacterized membrane protein YkvI
MRYLLFLLLLMIAVMPLAGCEVVEGVFKAGVWVGALMVVLIVGAVAFIVTRIRS